MRIQISLVILALSCAGCSTIGNGKVDVPYSSRVQELATKYDLSWEDASKGIQAAWKAYQGGDTDDLQAYARDFAQDLKAAREKRNRREAPAVAAALAKLKDSLWQEYALALQAERDRREATVHARLDAIEARLHTLPQADAPPSVPELEVPADWSVESVAPERAKMLDILNQIQ